MAYVLRNIHTGETAVMGNNGTYTLGRSRKNDLMLRDKSCSHEHAVIKIKNGYATIIDIGSKRGTYVNTEKINDETKLQTGDIILFGLKNCKYSFIDPKFLTVLDNSVSGNIKIALDLTLTALNIQILKNYVQECTHYTSQVINMDTLKKSRILDALIDGIPIVTPKFWIDIQELVEIPNIYRYKPKIEDPLKDLGGVHNILHKKKRKELFKAKMFIFYDRTLETRLEHLIWKCGGGTIQHNNDSNFATTLVEAMEFDEAIIVTAEPIVYMPLVKSYFIDKLRQYHKTVQELSEDEFYSAIFEGCFKGSPTEPDKEVQAVECRSSLANEDNRAVDPVQDRFANRPGTSKSSTNEPIKKKTSKTGWTTLNRWIRVEKGHKDQAKSTVPAEKARVAENNDEFDMSLDMSDDSGEEPAKELRNSDDARTSRGKNTRQTATEKGSGTNWTASRRQIEPAEMTRPRAKNVVPAGQDEFNTSLDMSSDRSSDKRLQELPNSDNNNEPPPVKNIENLNTEKAPIQTKIQEKHKTKKNGQQLSCQVVVIDDRSSEEINDEIEKRLNPSTSPDRSEKRAEPIETLPQGANDKRNNSSSSSSPEIQRKRIRINPFAKHPRASNSKLKITTKLQPELKRLRVLFQDVEFQPLS